jgi:hypothetical protein
MPFHRQYSLLFKTNFEYDFPEPKVSAKPTGFLLKSPDRSKPSAFVALRKLAKHRNQRTAQQFVAASKPLKE